MLPNLPSSGSRDMQFLEKMSVPKRTSGPADDNPFTSHQTSMVTSLTPRYQILPRETDLRTPLPKDFPEKVLPLAAVKSRITRDVSLEAQTLAVSGLVKYGDIQVIAPVDVMKQIFKIPYSKSEEVSISVQLVDQTLVLNPGPDVDEGEKLIGSPCTKNVDESLFLNFAMHSVRMEEEKHTSSSPLPPAGENFRDSAPDDRLDNPVGNSSKQDGLIFKNKKSKNNKKSKKNKKNKNSQIRENINSSIESEKHGRGGSNEFSSVFLCQFFNFRMLLGSDLLLFSNEKNLPVSLHLWDVSEKVTPLTWLDAWLDNVMASVPELAICYHDKGVVQKYDQLETDNVFPQKAISEDGTAAFHPHDVQQHGLAVLRFLQSKCKKDPGAYWLYKSSGVDAMQLFDLSTISNPHSSSTISNPHSSSNHKDDGSPLPSFIHSRRRSDFMFSLGILLYRVGHRLSFSVVPNDRNRCAWFLVKCLDFLSELDHQVVRAYALEQCARFILKNDEEVKIPSLEEESPNPVAIAYSAVQYVFEAIMSLSTQQLQSHSKLWNLVLLLGEAYLYLAEAYEQDKQLLQALQTVKSACSLYGSMPPKFEESLFVSSMSLSLLSESQVTAQAKDLKAKSGNVSVGEVSSTSLFWSKAWMVVGDIHQAFLLLKRQPQFSEKAKQTHDLEMPPGVKKEIEMLKKLCGNSASGSGSISGVSHSGKKSVKSKSENASSRISKYLEVFDTVKHVDILYCYQESQRSLQGFGLPSGCNWYHSLLVKKGRVFNYLGLHQESEGLHQESEEAFAEAIKTFKEVCHHPGLALVYCNLGCLKYNRAANNCRRSADTRTKYQQKALETAKEEFWKAIEYYFEAKKELGAAISKDASSVPEKEKDDLHTDIARAYLAFGVFLARQVKASGQKKSTENILDSSSYKELSASGAIGEAIAIFESMKEIPKKKAADAYHELALYHKDCCLALYKAADASDQGSSPKAEIQHCMMANHNWGKAMELCGPNDPLFLEILRERSDLCLTVSKSEEFNSMMWLESAQSYLLEGRHISKECAEILETQHPESWKKFWRVFYTVVGTIKMTVSSKQEEAKASKRFRNAEKIQLFYDKARKARVLEDLNEIHGLWT